MTPSQTGLTHNRAFIPRNPGEREDLLRRTACAACAGTEIVSLDSHRGHRIGRLHIEEVYRTCPCGFTTRLFIITNEMTGAATPAVAALREARARGYLLSDDLIETGTAVRIALRAGETERAFSLARGIAEREPDVPETWFQLAVMYRHTDRYDEASSALDHLLDLVPALAEGWQLRAEIAAVTGRMDAASSARRHYRTLATGADTEDTQVIARDGPVTIAQDRFMRRLSIGDQVQSGCLLDPNSGAPTPLPASSFTAFWLVPAARHPRGHFLMLGLGSGIGAAMLCAAYPEARVTIVDSDPVVIAMARTWFPPVTEMVERDRIRIIAADAVRYLTETDHRFDAVLVDLYRDNPEMPVADEAERFAGAVTGLCANVWLNLIGRVGDTYPTRLLSAFGRAGHPIRFMTAGVGPVIRATKAVNWLTTTERVTSIDTTLPEPLARLGTLAEPIRAHLRCLARYIADADELREILAPG